MGHSCEVIGLWVFFNTGDEEISIPDHGVVITTFYYCYVNYQSGLLQKEDYHSFFDTIKMCRKLCHLFFEVYDSFIGQQILKL